MEKQINQKVQVEVDKLDKIMGEQGFEKAKYPIGNPKDQQTTDWYVKRKIPYTQAIRRTTLQSIIRDFKD